MERELNMAPTLAVDARSRFSETARLRTGRSQPRHGEAGRHRTDRTTLTVAARRVADDVPERAAEGAEAGEPDLQAHLRHVRVGRPQQEHGPLHAPPLQVTVRRLPEGRPEGSDEVGRGDA